MKDDADLAARIRALEAELLRPEVRASSRRVEELLAEDFVEFGASGRRWGRAACIESMAGEAGSAGAAGAGGACEIEDFELRMLAPDVALATYRLTAAAGSGPGGSLRSSIWRRDAGGWRMVFHQGTCAAD